MHAAPVLAVPYVQLHVLASHVVPSLDRWYGPAQLAHLPPPCVGHASPDVCTPLAHVHCFVAHSRSDVVVAADTWYWLDRHGVCDAQSRSDVDVGGTLSNCPAPQSELSAHSRSVVPVGATVWCCSLPHCSFATHASPDRW